MAHRRTRVARERGGARAGARSGCSWLYCTANGKWARCVQKCGAWSLRRGLRCACSPRLQHMTLQHGGRGADYERLGLCGLAACQHVCSPARLRLRRGIQPARIWHPHRVPRGTHTAAHGAMGVPPANKNSLFFAEQVLSDLPFYLSRSVRHHSSIHVNFLHTTRAVTGFSHSPPRAHTWYMLVHGGTCRLQRCPRSNGQFDQLFSTFTCTPLSAAHLSAQSTMRHASVSRKPPTAMRQP